ncbi:MAG: hypothetical protein CBB71_03625 [Rhodopirellula sp. TMED11]|nr:MAG: hypothetical protein CBB71_03625 [Rhodopirellula sp. TMED11]
MSQFNPLSAKLPMSAVHPNKTPDLAMKTRLDLNTLPTLRDGEPFGQLRRRLGTVGGCLLLLCWCTTSFTWAKPPTENTLSENTLSENTPVSTEPTTTAPSPPSTPAPAQAPAFEIKLPEGPFVHVQRNGQSDRAAIELLKAAIRGEKVMTTDPMMQTALRMIAKSPQLLPSAESAKVQSTQVESAKDKSATNSQPTANRPTLDEEISIDLQLPEPNTARSSVTLQATIREHQHDHAHDDHAHDDHAHDDHAPQAMRGNPSLFILTPDGKRKRILMTQPGPQGTPVLPSQAQSENHAPQPPRPTYQPPLRNQPRPSNGSQPSKIQVYTAPRSSLPPAITPRPSAILPPGPDTNYKLAESLLRSARLLEAADGNPGREQLIRHLRTEAASILRGGPTPRAVYPVPYTPRPTPPQGRSPVPSLPPAYPPPHRPEHSPKPKLLHQPKPAKPDLKD